MRRSQRSSPPESVPNPVTAAYTSATTNMYDRAGSMGTSAMSTPGAMRQIAATKRTASVMRDYGLTRGSRSESDKDRPMRAKAESAMTGMVT